MVHSDNISFKDKVVLITGAARGIGRACALAFAESGAEIALGLRDVNSDAGLVDQIRALGRKVVPLQLDVRDLHQIRAAMTAIENVFGRLDVLVNNAGIAPANLIEDYTESDYDDTVNVNLKGTFFVSQAAGKLMIPQKSGAIVNLSSQAGFIALPSESVYCMTKAGIAHLTRCFAVEWGKHNIRVNAVAPTFIKTPGTEVWLQNDEFRNNVLSNIILGKVGIPKDVANAVLFLASPAAAMITGTTLLIDGGWTAR